MRILYLDCFSGVSGDMALGALLHLGAPLAEVEAELAQLGLPGWHIRVEEAMSQGVSGVRVSVEVDGAQPHAEGEVVEAGAPSPGLLRALLAPAGTTHTHGDGHVHTHASDHTHLHSHPHEHTHRHAHTPGSTHTHAHPHTHNVGEDDHRPWRVIRELLEGAPLRPRVRARALATFGALAEAEGRIHGMPAEDVVFHEVGSLDAIVDVVGVAAALEILGIDRIVTGVLPVSRGFVDCAHGRMPLPAPATLELLRGLPVRPDARPGEWITPTGAALVRGLSEAYGEMPEMTLVGIGYGLGRRDGRGIPNALRVVLGEATDAVHRGGDTVIEVEANIDDMSPQLVAPAMDALLAAGALDVWATPVVMKKGRPGLKLSALCLPGDRPAVVEVLLRETSTIGVRWSARERRLLNRRIVQVETPFGQVRVKVSGDGLTATIAPEYDDCRVLATRAGVPVRFVIQAALVAAADPLDRPTRPPLDPPEES